MESHPMHISYEEGRIKTETFDENWSKTGYNMIF